MDDKFYKNAFDAALLDLAELMEQREELEDMIDSVNVQITNMRSAVIGLSKLADTDIEILKSNNPHLFPNLIPPDIGLTDAVRQVLQANHEFLTPVSVRGELLNMGFDASGHKNILASIHTILKRLAEAGEVTMSNAPEGGTIYKWIKIPPGNSPDPKPASDPTGFYPGAKSEKKTAPELSITEMLKGLKLEPPKKE